MARDTLGDYGRLLSYPQLHTLYRRKLKDRNRSSWPYGEEEEVQVTFEGFVWGPDMVGRMCRTGVGIRPERVPEVSGIVTGGWLWYRTKGTKFYGQPNKEKGMKVKELIEKLSEEDPEREVVLSHDEEGNGFEPVTDIGLGILTDDDEFVGEDDADEYPGARPALCLWP